MCLRLVAVAYLSLFAIQPSPATATASTNFHSATQPEATTAVTITERCLDALSSSPRFPFLLAADYWKLADDLPNANDQLACHKAGRKRKETEDNFFTKKGSSDADTWFDLFVNQTVVDPTVVPPTVVPPTVAHPTTVNQTWTTKELTRNLCFAGDVIGWLFAQPIIAVTSKVCHVAHGTWYALEDVYAGFGPDGIDCSKGLLCGFEAGKVNVFNLIVDSFEASTSAYGVYKDFTLLQKQKALTQERGDLLREKADIENVWWGKQKRLQQWSAKADNFRKRYNNWEAAWKEQIFSRTRDLFSHAHTVADSTLRSASAQFSNPRYMHAFMKRLQELVQAHMTSPPNAQW